MDIALGKFEIVHRRDRKDRCENHNTIKNLKSATYKIRI